MAPDSGSAGVTYYGPPQAPGHRSPAGPQPGIPGVPKYRTMERKDFRLRPDQIEDLDALTRRVKRARRRKPEPITDNTLLRVALDLLLANGHLLAGDTEDELRASVLRGRRG